MVGCYHGPPYPAKTTASDWFSIFCRKMWRLGLVIRQHHCVHLIAKITLSLKALKTDTQRASYDGLHAFCWKTVKLGCISIKSQCLRFNPPNMWLVPVYYSLQLIRQEYQNHVHSNQRPLRKEFMRIVPTPDRNYFRQDKLSVSTPICDSSHIEPYASAPRWHLHLAHQRWVLGSSTNRTSATRRSNCKITLS